jgi:hypothetical protein
MTTESGAAVVAKLAAPAGVSIATIFGYPPDTLLVWATLIFTLLLIAQKIMHIWRDIKRGLK